MLRIAIYVTFLSITTCQVAKACLFTDCPNEFSWSKKNYDSTALVRMMIAKSGRIGVGKNLFKCDEKPIGGEFPQCEFRGTRVCCSDTVFGSLDCQATSTESEPLEDVVIKRITSALEAYMTSTDPDLDRERCVNVGICCKQGTCTPETSCTTTCKQANRGKSPRNELSRLISKLIKTETEQ